MIFHARRRVLPQLDPHPSWISGRMTSPGAGTSAGGVGVRRTAGALPGI